MIVYGRRGLCIRKLKGDCYHIAHLEQEESAQSELKSTTRYGEELIWIIML